jgi:hypothetical protein
LVAITAISAIFPLISVICAICGKGFSDSGDPVAVTAILLLLLY